MIRLRGGTSCCLRSGQDGNQGESHAHRLSDHDANSFAATPAIRDQYIKCMSTPCFVVKQRLRLLNVELRLVFESWRPSPQGESTRKLAARLSRPVTCPAEPACRERSPQVCEALSSRKLPRERTVSKLLCSSSRRRWIHEKYDLVKHARTRSGTEQDTSGFRARGLLLVQSVT